jgi:two-component system probable response regulator PhcQ
MKHAVLLVDDEPSIRETLTRTLRREPYEIVDAASGQEALRTLASKRVDVVVADERMPGMTGTELLSRIRESYPDVMRIMLTGHASLDAAIRAINEGEVYRFLTKPCNPADLAMTIRRAIQHKELFAETQRLLKTVKHQAAVIEEIERANPGITQVRTTSDGAIVIDDDLPQDFDQFMKQVSERVEEAERLLQG